VDGVGKATGRSPSEVGRPADIKKMVSRITKARVDGAPRRRP
jgi:hypothetical protein